MKRIIAISGKQGSGKSSLADALVLALKAHDPKIHSVAILKFAGPLYAMHDYILNTMEHWTGKKPFTKCGPLLQYLGTEFGRGNYGENVWVDALKHLIGAESRENIIIDDCRFENEFNALPEALRVRLECSEEVRKARCPAWREDVNHPSETGLDNYAWERRFDIHLDTEVMPTAACVDIIMRRLEMIRTMPELYRQTAPELPNLTKQENL